jgi:GNAT superfamily N-acetyltransferase
VIVDAHLMDQLMRTSAGFGADTAAAFRSADPDDPAVSQPLGSGALVSWGAERYVNRAMGVSLDDLGDGELDELEAFYDSRGVPPSIEVVSWASPDLVARLVARRFVPIRFNDLLVIDPGRAVGAQESIAIHRVDDATTEAWSDTFVAGFATTPEDEQLNRELTRVVSLVPRSVHLIAEIDGAVVGCGSLYPQGPVGWIGGGATRPEFRQRGVQAALLHERLAYAGQAGCTVAAATAVAGSPSSRNMQRMGFTIAATILVMTLDPSRDDHRRDEAGQWGARPSWGEMR